MPVHWTCGPAPMISATTNSSRSPSRRRRVVPSMSGPSRTLLSGPHRCGQHWPTGVTCWGPRLLANNPSYGWVSWIDGFREETMTDRVTVGNLRVAQVLYDFINNEALPGTDIDPDSFWAGVDKVVTDLSPQNEELLARRDDLQAQIDKYHRQHVIEPIDPEGYQQFLTEIGYLQPEPDDFTITTAGVDDEITTTAGPQLVVPILNARFALNAANARWGSLYDALYGTDVIPEDDGAEKGSSYNKVRGDKVIAYARRFLDGATPLATGAWSEATGLEISQEDGTGQLLITLGDGLSTGLA